MGGGGGGGGGGVVGFDFHAYILLYVDDIIFTCSDPHRVISW